MICPACKTEIADNSLICPSCGEEILCKQRREKCAETKKSWQNTLSLEFRKPLFLGCMICLALISLILLINAIVPLFDFEPALTTSLFYLLILTLTAFSLVSSVKAYLKKEPLVGRDLRFIHYFSTLMMTLGILMIVTVSILTVILLIVGATVASLANKVSGAADSLSDFSDEIGDSFGEELFGDLSGFLHLSGTLLVVVILILCTLLILFAVNFTLTYSRANKFYKTIARSLDKLDPSKKIVAPVKRMYVFGILTALLGCLCFAGSWQLALFLIGIGGYTFIHGLFFRSIAASYQNTLDEIQRDRDALKEAEEQTASLRARQKAELEEKRQQEERQRLAEEQKRRDEEQRRRDEDQRRKDEEMKAMYTQQMMFQQMMQQQMQQQFMNMQNQQNPQSQQNNPPQNQTPSEESPAEKQS